MATPVRIVRPKKRGAEIFEETLYSVFGLALRAWIVMLLAPLAGFTPGYWTTVGLLYLATCVLSVDSHRLWTSGK